MPWYYVKGEKRHGPVEQAELADFLARRILEPSDLVWNESLGARWVPASSVPGLCVAGAPPLPGPEGAPPPEPPPMERVLPPEVRGAAPSCLDPVGPAWTRTGSMLFKPFSMAKWFALGVSAWLATLGQGGSQGLGPINYDAGDMGELVDAVANDSGGAGGGAGVADFTQKAGSFLAAHVGWIVLGVGLVVVLGLALGLTMLWVRCRAKFVFLDNVVHDRTDVRNPWNRYARLGNSLFLWSFAYGLVFAVVMIAIVLVAVVGVVVPCVRAGAFVAGTMGPLVLALLLLVLVLLANAYVMRFLEDFVVPIMYRLDLTASEAWRRFRTLLRPQFWRFLLYGIFYGVLGLGAGSIVLVAVILTCCLAGCLMIIPYVGAVVILPVTVFFRLYSVEYLAQFGPEYRLLEDERAGG